MARLKEQSSSNYYRARRIRMTRFRSSDPTVMDIPEDVLAAQRQMNVALAGFPHPDVRRPEGLEQLRSLTANNEAGTVLAPNDSVLSIPSGDVRLHTFVPEGRIRAVFMRIHGGGWAAGAPEDDDTLNDLYARTCGVVVVSPEYRLVPEVTIVDQIAECVAVAEWLGSNAADEYGTDTLLIGGISAGGHLAAATLLRLRAAGSPTFAKIAGAVLDSGAYDFGRTPSAYLADDNTLVVPGSWLTAFIDMGLPGYSVDERRAPEISPLLNDLAGLPPALFTVGDLDPLRDDTLLMAQRWQLAGSDAELDVWPEGAHAFANMATPLGDLALDRTTAWISSVLDVRESR
jgi:acetyl esterase